jgi:hypothetical protein
MTEQSQTETAATPTDPWLFPRDKANAMATDALARMTKKYLEANRPKYDPVAERYQSKGHRIDRLVSGDPKERAHFEEALKAKIEADPTEAAFTGEIGEVPSSELRRQSELASYLRSQGHPDEVVREALTTADAPISKELHGQLKTWKAKALSNPEWSAAWLSGSVEHRLQMESCIIALMHPVEESAA